MDKFRRVLYVSEASGEWRNGLSAALANIVMTCTHFNAGNHVTGVLAFRNGTFLQVLEGPPPIIGRLIQRISRDARHSEMQVLVDEESESKSFSKWLYRLAPSSEMPAEFVRFVSARYSAIALQADPKSLGMLKLFHTPSVQAMSAIPGVSLRGTSHEMTIEGTTPGLTRGLDSQRLEAVGLLLGGWRSFDLLQRETGLPPDALDSLLLRFRESGLLKVRSRKRQVESVPATEVQSGFYATLRRFLLGT